ncbi:MAG: phenylacetic acid degradation protein [Sphingomonadales bacterium CG12_big_fil_rev_8_21_14_0_65_65_10]|jgi:uncharacterized protein (TIGR00369 family)|uniref:Thioesterase domain-containing protein n=2 Tax=Blastomonas marina TaxID=1867408 RepID=A0ABQ1F5E7_9SPHN|nr:MAG: phenylacetic acid degradation protein [Sphingomonadales bacterium CG12_big_fil_rev_8_21_14_0_65_65_10]GFZ99218.1 hypothetical protein GCM10010923_04400 [Blastomonas marina]
MSDRPATTNIQPDLLAKALTRGGHGGWLGMQYHAHGDGWVELALPWKQELVGMEESGILASGPIISLMDNCTSMSVWTKRDAFVPQVTLDLRIDYTRAATPGSTVIGRGECYKLTRSMSFVRGIAYEDDPDDPLAHAAGVFMMIGND